VEDKVIRSSPGNVYVTLIIRANANAEDLRQQYLDACLPEIPIGQVLTVSVARLCL